MDHEERFFAHLVLVDVHPPLQTQVARRVVGDFDPGTGVFAGYDLQVRYVDAVIARLLDELFRMERRDTLLVFNSDHGEGFEEARPDDRFHGGHLHDSTLWVPLRALHPSRRSASGGARMPP
ncbi:MAG: sulfatase-like hydrolase/transferase [Myxococcota bacterium]|nr:sulfatase-like hydrolase/transferase [Myxococcota bacterium]